MVGVTEGNVYSVVIVLVPAFSPLLYETTSPLASITVILSFEIKARYKPRLFAGASYTNFTSLSPFISLSLRDKIDVSPSSSVM